MNAFQVMSEPIRRRIVEVLASGEHSAGNICDVIVAEFGVTRSAVFHHLAILRDNRWVDVLPDYTTRYYRLEPGAWKQLEEEVRWLKRLWKRRIGSMSGNEADPAFARHPDERSTAERGDTARPGDAKRPKKAKPGSAKGLRGKGRRADVWTRLD